LDDFAASTSQQFDLLRDELRLLRTEIHDEFRAMRSDMASMQRQIAQIGWTLVVALIGAIVALIVALA
jgi:hypothetical protein